MTTMNRLLHFYSEKVNNGKFLSAQLNKFEFGAYVVRTSIDKHKRGNCFQIPDCSVGTARFRINMFLCTAYLADGQAVFLFARKVYAKLTRLYVEWVSVEDQNCLAKRTALGCIGNTLIQ